MTRHGRIYGVLATLALCAAAGVSLGQVGGTAGAPPGGAADQAPVTREEFNKMMQEMSSLRQEVTDLKSQRAASTQSGAAGSDVEQLRKEVADLKKQRAED